MAIGPSLVFEGFPQQCGSLVMTKAAGIADQGVVRRDLVVLDAPSPVDEGKIEQFARFQRGLPQARFFDQSTNRVGWVGLRRSSSCSKMVARRSRWPLVSR